jgi:hypothetical protein
VPKKKAKLPLSKTHPKLAKEAYGWNPDNFTSGSNKKLEWKCSLEHIWASKISHRTSGSNCPYCYGRYAWPGFNDLATTHPELAKKLVGTDPTTTTYSSHKKLTWKCDYGHIWEARLNAKTKSGCPYCANLKVLEGFNDLATTHPELAKELVDTDPKKIISGSSKKYKWRCAANHFWEISSAARVSGNGCPFCSGRLAIAGVNDLRTIDPDLAIELVETDPSTIKRNSGKKLKWRCKKGHIFIARAASRKIDSGCPYCTNKKVLEGFNDLATTHPELAKELVDTDPKKLIGGSLKRVSWICSVGHSYKTTVYSRSYQKTGCPYCSSQEILFGFNDLSTTHPELASQAFGWDPAKFISNGRNKVRWKCPLGHIYSTVIANRKQGSGCPFCSHHKVLAGFNDLNFKFPEIAKEAYGWDPTKILPGSSKIKKWRCSNGHSWNTSPASRTNMESGCPSCNTGGYDPNKRAFLYFLNHKNWQMHQIGITNIPDDRLGDHRKLGWEVVELRGPMDGHLTQQWETAILRMLKAKGADLANAKIAGKFDGYSEAWSKSTFPVKSIKELMRLTEEFEEGL